MNDKQEEQMDRIRDRFTRTADVFSDFVLATRAPEAEQLIKMVAPSPHETAVDFACGPGTMLRSFASHVKWICGLDLTPAMLERARRTAREKGQSNVYFCCADAMTLPFADGSINIAVGSYCLHHIPDPAKVIREFARALRPGGRLGILDITVPDDRAKAELNDQIERIRDDSHERKFSERELEDLVKSAGLEIRKAGRAREFRTFDHWMQVAGWKRGDPAYEEARQLMEASIPGDKSGFAPRFVMGDDGKPDLEFSQEQFFLVAEKPATAREA